MALPSSVCLRSEQAVISGDHDTRRPDQGDDRHTRARGLGERAHPDTRPGVRGTTSLDRIVAVGGHRCL